MTKRPDAPAVFEGDGAAARIAELEARVAELTAQLASHGTSEERSQAAQDAHRQLEAKFRAVVETSQEGILLGDPSGKTPWDPMSAELATTRRTRTPVVGSRGCVSRETALSG